MDFIRKTADPPWSTAKADGFAVDHPSLRAGRVGFSLGFHSSLSRGLGMPSLADYNLSAIHFWSVGRFATFIGKKSSEQV